MSTPGTIGWKDSAREASLSQLPDHIQRAIEIAPCRMHQRTNHRHHATGAPHRPAMPPRDPLFYRAVGITYLHSGAGGGPTDWPANLLANPTFTFHLKNGIRADLPARATPVTDPTKRQAVLAANRRGSQSAPRPRHNSADTARRLGSQPADAHQLPSSVVIHRLPLRYFRTRPLAR